MDTIIKNGTIVTSTDTHKADILIENEIITRIEKNLNGKADRIINADGDYIFPGGIDVHTHLDMPFGGTVSADNFQTGHIAAAFGGTTTHIDFAIQGKGQTLKQTLNIWQAKAEGKACIDYGFHIAVTDLPDSILEEIPSVLEYGVSSLKLFMAYKGILQVDDSLLLRTLKVAKDHGILVCVHAENGDVIEVLVNDMVNQGKLDPIFHAKSRPHLAEAEATSRAIFLAQIADAPIYIVHLSCKSALEQVRKARQQGLNVLAETCSQYLFCSESDLDKPNFEGAKFVCSPPMRTEEDQQALWQGLANDDLQVVATDHCPFNFKGQKDMGRDNFTQIPNGCPGIEDRLKVLYTQGVATGKFSINRFVELTATNPAKIFGLYPQKGTIAAGSDADLIIFDPEKEHVISSATHHMNIDYNLYEGMQIKGMPKTVLLRGNVIIENDQFTGETGSGRFIKRKAFAL